MDKVKFLLTLDSFLSCQHRGLEIDALFSSLAQFLFQFPFPVCSRRVILLAFTCLKAISWDHKTFFSFPGCAFSPSPKCIPMEVFLWIRAVNGNCCCPLCDLASFLGQTFCWALRPGLCPDLSFYSRLKNIISIVLHSRTNSSNNLIFWSYKVYLFKIKIDLKNSSRSSVLFSSVGICSSGSSIHLFCSLNHLT